MIGIVLGTLGAVVLARTVIRHRRYGVGFHGGFGPQGGGFYGARGFGRRRGGGGPLRALFARLETTPGQEKVIVEAIDEARSSLRGARGEWKASRDDLARAIASDAFDEALLGGAFSRQDEKLADVRKALTGALAKVHEALEPKQREILAQIIAEGPGAFAFRGAAIHV